MDISKLLKENDKILGVMIVDGTETYPVFIESLHNPMILDELLENGWELRRLPYGLYKEGIYLEDYPSIEYSDAGVTEQQERDMYDLKSVLYKEVDLKSKMVNIEVPVITMNKSTCLINTREDLVKFLEESNKTNLNVDIPTTYLPLNSFVNPIALFTPEEYYLSENSKYIAMIEKRRTLSFKNFNNLVKFFKKIGMLSENYTMKNFMDAYFSWGYCGMKLIVHDRTTQTEYIKIDSPARYERDEKFIPFLTYTKESYMDSMGVVYRPEGSKGSEWQIVETEDERNEKAADLRKLGYNFISPVSIKTRISDESTLLVCDGVDIKYTVDSLLITLKTGEEYGLIPISVLKPDNISQIPMSTLELMCSDREELYKEFYIDSIIRDLIERTTIYTTGSTFRALESIGVSPLSAANYVLNKEERLATQYSMVTGGEDIDIEELTEPELARYMPLPRQMFLKVLAQFIEGDLLPQETYYTECKNFFDSLINGDIMIDSIAGGMQFQSAASAASKDYYKYITVAHKYLGLSLDDIAREVSVIDIKNISEEEEMNGIYIDFKGEDRVLRMNVNLINSMEKGYQKDMDDYIKKQGREGGFVTYVKAIIEELGGEHHSKRRHVGVVANSINLGNAKVWKKVEPIMEELKTQLFEKIEMLRESRFIKAKLRETYNITSYTWLFEILETGHYSFTPRLGGERVQAPLSWRNALQGIVEVTVDSTLNFCEMMTSPTGEFCTYCVNAVITPFYVLPRKGYSKIPVYPFIPTWVNTVGMDEKRASWANPSLHPVSLLISPNHKGYSQHYQHLRVPRPALTQTEKVYDIYKDHKGLTYYWENAKKYYSEIGTDKQLSNPPHPYELYYTKRLNEDDYEELISMAPRDNGESGPQMWFMPEVYFVNYTDIIFKSEELKLVFNPTRASLEMKSGFKLFRGFTPEDFMALSNLESLGIHEGIPGEIPLVHVKNETQAYFGETLFNYVDVERLAEDPKYKVKHLVGRKYLCETAYGKIYEVTV